MQIKIRQATTRSKFSQTQIKRIEELASNATINKVAEQFGMEEETFCKMLKRQKPALRSYKKGRTIGALRAAQSLQKRMDVGDVEAAMFFLKLHGGWDDEPECEITNKVSSSPIIKITINNKSLELKNN